MTLGRLVDNLVKFWRKLPPPSEGYIEKYALQKKKV